MRIHRILASVLVVAIVSAGVVVSGRPASAAAAYSASVVSHLATVANAYGGNAARTSIAGATFNGSGVRAVVYSPGNVRDLGAFPGFAHSHGRDVNGAGQAVGFLSSQLHGFNISDRAFVHTGGTLTQLPMLSGVGHTHAYGINDAGTVVGISAYKPFSYTIGSNALTQLPTPPTGDGSGGARGINTAGDIVGWAGVATMRRPALWKNGTGSLLALPAGAASGEAMIVTDDDIILGQASYAGSTRATRYDANGAATDLGTLGGSYSEPTDASAAGQIVGWSYLAGPTFQQAAFLYENGQMLDLNALLPDGSGWVLQRAYTIDDAGEIVGVGTFDGTRSGFRLTPVPEPTGVVLIGAMVATGLARRRWRQRSPRHPLE